MAGMNMLVDNVVEQQLEETTCLYRLEEINENITERTKVFKYIFIVSITEGFN